MRGRTHRTDNLEPVIRQNSAVRSSIFVGWHNLENFAVSLKNYYRHFVSVPGLGDIGRRLAFCTYLHLQGLRTILTFSETTLNVLSIYYSRVQLRSIRPCSLSVLSVPRSAVQATFLCWLTFGL